MTIRKMSGSEGGVKLSSMAASTMCRSFTVMAYVGADNTAKSTGAVGTAQFIAIRQDGSNGDAAFTANTNIFAVRAKNDGTEQAKFLIDEDGDVHYDGGTNATAWDDYCDVALLTATRAIGMPECSDFKNRFSGFIDAHACVLEQTGVVHLNRDTDSIPFVSTKGLNGLIIDSIRQVNDRVIGLETQLNALQGGCP